MWVTRILAHVSSVAAALWLRKCTRFPSRYTVRIAAAVRRISSSVPRKVKMSEAHSSLPTQRNRLRGWGVHTLSLLYPCIDVSLGYPFIVKRSRRISEKKPTKMCNLQESARIISDMFKTAEVDCSKNTKARWPSRCSSEHHQWIFWFYKTNLLESVSSAPWAVRVWYTTTYFRPPNSDHYLFVRNI